MRTYTTLTIPQFGNTGGLQFMQSSLSRRPSTNRKTSLCTPRHNVMIVINLRGLGRTGQTNAQAHVRAHAGKRAEEQPPQGRRAVARPTLLLLQGTPPGVSSYKFSACNTGKEASSPTVLVSHTVHNAEDGPMRAIRSCWASITQHFPPSHLISLLTRICLSLSLSLSSVRFLI